jgi:hypothetical protein
MKETEFVFELLFIYENYNRFRRAYELLISEGPS